MGGNMSYDLRLPVNLHTERQEAQIAWTSADTPGDLPLQGEDQAEGREPGFQQVPQESGSYIVRDVGNNDIFPARYKLTWSKRQDISGNNPDVGKGINHLLERRDEVAIQLNSHH